ncbi:hypothetical protein EJ06DRAFT_68847 [Trichodelitschia bisporula]|uniref:DUF974-domain-containing protein n=1 Tax=Trichodelitschia bisporula TaxID=703511 RepID=A0A6G1HTJ0_9PEZI|nr:hypothetical protein EJ06DRAFT_68847 [Trichodelitschia bisporula]
MSRARAPSVGESLKTPHSVSLKVLRLSRPSLAPQTPLPPDSSSPLGLHFSAHASRADPSGSSIRDGFGVGLAPALLLPESFGGAYVGETFACALAANNEVPSGDPREVSGLKVVAEIQTPGAAAGTWVGVGLEGEHEGEEGFEPGASRQWILRLALKEEGQHTLGVTVTYTETGAAGEARTRSFRKLYQFAATNLVGVRTKAGDLPPRAGRGRYALEAQLENLGERGVAIESVSVAPRPPFTSTSLNWDVAGDAARAPVLNPHDVYQVAFILEEGEEKKGEDEEQTPAGGKLVLGQLHIQWRGSMGDRGTLTTGWLTGRRR